MTRKVKVTIKKCMGDAPESEWPVEWEGFADWDGRQVALPETGIKSNGEYKLYFDTDEGLETVSEMTALEDIGQDLIDAGWLFREVIEEISDTTHTVTLTYTRASLDENADVRPVVVTDESGSMARLKAIREMRRRTFGPGND